ncbi:TolC family protein [Rubinisphaera sp.]|uniref:TolC family protein n=1 Tax=Rubinisphaera sp. TaxID=2024857 RepID=UPI000C10DED4|nr:TolC family protein [Rubinisphaera sp.]MBV09880.1 hypothetical protein [Rubinisphaera sp.]HCS50529.1 hypothetical protein [Planctomycetaceae bacterium]
MPARFLYFVLLLGIAGCSASEKLNSVVTNEKPRVRSPERVVASAEDSSSIVLVGLKEDSQPQQIQTTESLSIDEAFITNENTSIARSDSNSERIYLESLAADQNPKLIRLYREYQTAASRSHYVDKLPDPKLGANVFGNPVETASGSQQANISLSQTIPWLSRLNAEQQRACFEAMAIRAEYAAERLRVIAAVQTQWARLYLIEQQIEITQANQLLLESLIDVANSRVSIGKASQGDVLLGTVEYSKLEEQLLVFRQQKQSVVSELNRLTGRPAGTPIKPPAKLDILKPEWSLQEVTQIALNEQPEIQAAHLRTQATEWGIEVARLMRRPEFMISASYFITDDNRPPSPFVNVGEDPWALGAQISIPIWRDKYDAIKNEAGWKHQAAHNSVQELLDRYDALLLDLVTESHRAAETANLYKSSILPQAEQTLAADQDAYINGVVEFDRVIRDYRNLFTLELGYHKAISDLTIANAKIQQAAGVPVPLKNAAK